MSLKDKDAKKAAGSPAQSFFRGAHSDQPPVSPAPTTPGSHEHATEVSQTSAFQAAQGDGPLNAGELKKMMGLLHYQSNKGVEIAREALATYKNLTHSEKHTFLNKYKEKGGKDLGWVKSFTASSIQESVEKDTFKEGWFYRTCVRGVVKTTPPQQKHKQFKHKNNNNKDTAQTKTTNFA